MPEIDAHFERHLHDADKPADEGELWAGVITHEGETLEVAVYVTGSALSTGRQDTRTKVIDRVKLTALGLPSQKHLLREMAVRGPFLITSHDIVD